jgi:catechol 2,3-dioxygenase-like lactoylglutathione lyase family enzyme
MKATIEKLSAVTLKVADMQKSVEFYQDVLGLEILYGGPNASEFQSMAALRDCGDGRDYQLSCTPDRCAFFFKLFGESLYNRSVPCCSKTTPSTETPLRWRGCELPLASCS